MSRIDQKPAGGSKEDDEDVRLMCLVGTGNTQAFEELIERHQSLVAGTVARMLGSNSEVEEIPLKDETSPMPDASLLENELQEAIEKAITELPERQRMALVLRRYEELNYEQIAEILDLSVPAVKSILFRARTELRARLNKYLNT